MAAVTAHRAATGSPVERVVNLLKDLKTRIEQDGENEQQVYDKYACFCDKAMKAKADTIDAAKAQLRRSAQEILKLRGHVATRKSEIAELDEAIQVNADMQADSTAIRQKENSAHMSETAEMKEALEALEQAIILLKDATKRALIQTNTGTSFSSAAAATARVIQALPAKAILAPQQLTQLTSFAQAQEGYAPQSETIQGILGNMYDTFSADLEASTQAEATSQRDFEQLIALKVNESQAMQAVRLEREDDKAKAEQLLAEETTLYDDTEAQMKADIDYFDVTKANCEAKADEWGSRSSLRTAELKGINAALAMLTTDSARELFANAIKPGKETRADASYDAGLNLTSFLQTASDEDASAPVVRAYALLKAQASSAHSLRLAQLAVSVREAKVGHFDQVIKAIGDMVVTLLDEDAADIAKRDQCKSEYQKVASSVADLDWKIKNNQATIDKLDGLIEQRKVERTQTVSEIKAVSDQMVAMTVQRNAENQDFTSEKQDDQDAIKLLDAAKATLAEYYRKNKIEMGPIQGSAKGLALEQRQEPEFERSLFDAPDADFAGKGSRKVESKDILSLMTMLIEDLTDEIRNGMKDEEAAQSQYEAAMKAAEKLKAELVAKKLSLQDAIAQRTTEKAEEEKTQAYNEAERKDEVDYKDKITPDCDWIIGAFAGRAERRQAELAGLRGAKDYLAGASEAALLQQRQRGAASFDDSALSKVRFLGLSA